VADVIEAFAVQPTTCEERAPEPGLHAAAGQNGAVEVMGLEGSSRARGRRGPTGGSGSGCGAIAGVPFFQECRDGLLCAVQVVHGMISNRSFQLTKNH